jgi:hypothetical protein
VQALLEAPGEELQLEGAHGLWELAICKDHHVDVLPELLAAAVKGLASPSVQVREAAASAQGALGMATCWRLALMCA